LDFGFTEKEDSFRKEVRDLLTQVLPADWAERSLIHPGGAATNHADMADMQNLVIHNEALRRMLQKGWQTMTWPDPWSRGKHTNVEQAIFAEELSYHKLPPLGAELKIVAPMIIIHGTEENRKEWLPKIARGGLKFFLGYSEPNHGSDLSSIESRAVEDGESLILSGQKIWSSLAHEATHGLLIARTDHDASKKHKGVSLLIVDMTLPGITVRPIVNILGLHSFNEVVFENVRVPRSCLIGEKNKGFHYLVTALDFERLLIVPVGGFERLLEELVRYAKETEYDGYPLSKDPQVRRKLAQLAIEVEIVRLLHYRTACMLDKGNVPNIEASALHLLGGELSLRMANIAAEIVGLSAFLLPGSKWAPLHGKLSYGLLDGISGGIAGGTNEIQRNIIATRGLGLPRN